MTAPRYSLLIEKVAEAIFDANPGKNAALQWHHAAVPKKRYRVQAQAAIEAMQQFRRAEVEDILNRHGATFDGTDWTNVTKAAEKEINAFLARLEAKT
jgi:hypothetical protein